MKLLSLLLLFMLAIGFEVPRLISRKYWKELIIFSLLLSGGFILCFILIFDIPFPPITTSITDLVKHGLQWLKKNGS